jgi:hypothetical protein
MTDPTVDIEVVLRVVVHVVWVLRPLIELH